MKKFSKTTKEITGAVLFGIIIFIAIEAISWIITCGIIKLIAMCFGWTFKWSVATGIWLVMEILRSVFKSNVTVKK